jgi:hypothetical protein
MSLLSGGCLSRLLLIAATVAAYQVAAHAQAPPPRVQSCVTETGVELKLVPRDEGPNSSDFVDFRRRLQVLIADRSEAALLSIVHPEIKAGFDGADGIEGFRRQHLNNADEDFWQEFARILTWGGRFLQPWQFVAPDVFASWPDEADAFECLAVVGTGVRLRERPSTNARILGVLNHAIVQIAQTEPGTLSASGWQRVRTAAGRSGYISQHYLRSPVDHRAIFETRDGRWWLVAYLAGD